MLKKVITKGFKIATIVTTMLTIYLSMKMNLKTNFKICRDNNCGEGTSKTSFYYGLNFGPKINNENEKAKSQRICNQTERIHFISQQAKSLKSVSKVRFLVDKEHRFAYCNIEKAASSTMKHIMMLSTSKGKTIGKLIGGVHKLQNLKKRGLHYAYYSKNKFSNYTKVMIVRNPYSRLIAAYKDKLWRPYERTDDHFEWLSSARNHINQWAGRKKVKWSSSNYPRVAFVDFVRFLLNDRKPYLADVKEQTDENTTNNIENEKALKVNSRKIAKFRNDPHWKPYFQNCNPRLINYDYILRTETFANDLQLILPILNNTAVSVADLSLNQASKSYTQPRDLQSKPYTDNKATSLSNKETEHKAETSSKLKLYTELPRQLLLKIVQKYKLDAKVFGYSFDAYTFVENCEIASEHGQSCC